MATNLTAGSIAFTGFNADGNDNLAFVLLEDIAAGTVINFTDNAYVSGKFVLGESAWSWTATDDIEAGTVVTMDNLAAGLTSTSNLGTIAWTDETARGLDTGAEVVYAYTGDATAPTFLTAISNDTIGRVPVGSFSGAGLTNGVNAIGFATSNSSTLNYDIVAYNGPHATGENLSNLRAFLFDKAYWLTQNTDGDDSTDGTAPDVPFDTTPFSVDSNAQQIRFSADTLTVTHDEGDSGTTIYTFVVERTNGTAGDVNFTGTFLRNTTLATDYPGNALPATAFSGIIPDGEASTTITITIAADTVYEPAAEENFGLRLDKAWNDTVAAYVSPGAPENIATGVIVNDDTQQIVGFAADSVKMLFPEGDDGTTTVTFTIERTGDGGTVGDVAFAGSFARVSTNAADFPGGVEPGAFSGVIPDGETSATVTVTFAGDTTPEGHEYFELLLTSATNPAAENVALGVRQGRAYILNDDGPSVVHSGETITGNIGLTGQATLTIEQGAAINTISVVGENFEATINNAGTMNGGFTSPIGNGKITVNNEATGVMSSMNVPDYGAPDSVEVTFNNAGLTRSVGAANSYKNITINNLAGGVIDTGTGKVNGISVIDDATINNAGKIVAASNDGPREGIEYKGTGVVVNNLAGGWIEGGHHAVTGAGIVTVTNEAGGTMIGRNGSAVNIDGRTTPGEAHTIINRGLMQGMSANSIDSDGDAVDTDGSANIENWGTIEGLGHNGSHNGGLNVSEGIAIGGGSVVNYEGGMISGYGRGITVDNSDEGAAWEAVSITNAGTIKGDGNLPTFPVGFPNAGPVAAYAPLMNGAEAVNIIGDWADTLTNAKTGKIVGGVKMDGGDDIVVNKGSMTATGGSAVNLGDGDDTFEAYTGSTVTGLIDGGAGNDTLRLLGTGVGTLGANTNFETLDVQSGMWTIESDAYDAVKVAAGAMVMSQIELADHGKMDVAAGATILTTDGSGAVVSDGAAVVNNAGVIQALGAQGAAAAQAINVVGGEVYNKVGSLVLSQGVAIASNGASDPGVTIVNDGMIRSLSDEAIVLNGDAGDLLVNTRSGSIVGKISTGGGNDLVTNQGSVVAVNGIAFDLGDGNDTLNLHDGSIVVGDIVLGAGNDVLSSQSASDLVIDAGDGQDSIATGAGNDRIFGGAGIDLIHAGAGNDIVHGGDDNDQLRGGDGDDELYGDAGDDYLEGGAGNDIVHGGEGNDRIVAGVGDLIYGDQGDDTIEVSIQGGNPVSIDGGEGDDTVKLLGTGTGTFGKTVAVETLDVAAGAWTVGGTADYDAISIAAGASVMNTISVAHDMTVTVGGTLNSGSKRGITADSGLGDGASLAVKVLEGGRIIAGDDAIRIKGNFDNGTVNINNAGLIQATGGQAIDLTDVTSKTTQITIVNESTGVLTAFNADAVRGGGNTTIDNFGVITSVSTADDLNDGIDFQDDGNGTVINRAGASIIGAHHGVTGAQGVTVVNEAGGTIMGQSGSAVNIDSDGSVESTVTVTNRGIMLGNADARQSDSDGDAVDVDGLVKLDNYGQIRGTGANGYHKGTTAEDANISEGVAVGGGTIHNYAGAMIYGYGRAIQVDNSSNGGALAATTITNEGVIQGDGHGPENVNADHAAAMQARIDGREAIDILGTFNDTVTNSGQIIGGVFTDGGDDSLTNSGTMIALKDMAIDMGAGNDTVWNKTSGVVSGIVALGEGDDRLNNEGTITVTHGNAVSMGGGDDYFGLSGTVTGNVDAGAGNDEVNIQSTGHIFGAVSFGDGNDRLYTSGEIKAGSADAVAVDMGAGDDWVTLYNGTTMQGTIRLGDGNDFLTSTSGGGFVIDAGDGDDQIYLSSMVIGGDDVIDGGNGNDTIYAGIGNDEIRGGFGDDILVGEDGSDTYIYGYHHGSDIIREGAGQAGDVDTLVFTDNSDGSLTFYKHGNDLVIEVENGVGYVNSTITVTDQFAGGGIENINLDNGDVWNRDDILAHLVDRGPTAEDVKLPTVNEDAASFVISFDKLLEHASDEDLDTLTVSAIADFVGGTAEITADGVKFTLDLNYNGEASFSFTVDDGRGGTAVAHASFDVTPVNDAPDVAPVAAVTLDEDTQASGQVIATDVEGDHLTYVIKGDGAANGAAAIDEHGNWTYTPGANYHGSDSFVVIVSDGQASTETTINLTVNSVNDLPVAVDDAGRAGEHEVATFDLVANDTDIENGQPRLTGFTVTGVEGDLSVSAEAAANAFQIVDGKLVYDDSTNIFGALNDGQVETVTISYTATDDDGGTANGTFVLTIDGVTDMNVISGTDGSDVLFDTAGDDHIIGKDGNDVIFTSAGSDIVDAGDGNDIVTALTGNATVNGGAGNDTLIGGFGDTVLNGDDGNDTIIGGFGNEVLNGGAGNDTLIATGGNDRLIGGQGDDLLIGGTGSDTFVFKPGDGHDTVLGFQVSGINHDVIEVDADVFGSFDAVMAAIRDTGAGAQLEYMDGSKLTLTGVAKDHLVVDDFRFA